MRRLVFTITAGRTGTEWLSNLMSQNLACQSVHELIGFGDIGLRTPDIGVMQSFNVWGNIPRVREFWGRKFSLLPEEEFYVETNHALSKAGLVENLDLLPAEADVSLVILRRDWHSQAMSYLRRGDFSNYTIPWQWYLDKRYPRRIVDPTPLEPFGQAGFAVWYLLEMDARQHYYQILYGKRYRFLEIDLESVSREAGATRFLGYFGFEGEAKIPDKANVGVSQADPKDEQRVERILGALRIDTKALALGFINAGGRLGEPARVTNSVNE